MRRSERDPLLSQEEGVSLIHKQELSVESKWCFLLKYSIVLIIFKGCEEMATTTLKQYAFVWCENNTATSSSGGTGENNSSNGTLCGHKEETAAQQLASRWQLYFDLLNAVILYFTVAVFGTFSDHLGRKVFVCLALAGWTARCGIISIVIYYDLHISWILLAYGVDGLGGSLYMISVATFAYTADTTLQAQERVFGMTVMEMVLGVGKMTTQFGNGYFINRYGFFYPMLTTTLGSLLALVVALLFLNDPKRTHLSNAKHTQLTQSSRLPSCRTLFKSYIGFYSHSDHNQNRTIFWICLMTFFVTEFGTFGQSEPKVLYQLGPPFCWSSEEISWYNAVYILVTFIVSCFFLKLLQRCCSDPVIGCLGLISMIGYCVTTGLAQSSIWLFIAVGFGFLMALPRSILRGIASSKASSHLQDTVHLVFELCAYDKYVTGEESFWCDLLSDNDRLIVEYSDELATYYEHNGHPIIPKMTCPLVRDLFHTMGNSMNETWDYRNLTADVENQGYMAGRFLDGHSTTTLSLMTTLGLFQESSPLTASERNENRVFKSSHIAPFSANIGFALYACRDNNNGLKNTFKVKMFVNEQAMIIPGCNDMLCPYETFRDMYTDLISNCDLASICTEDDVSNGSEIKTEVNLSLAIFSIIFATTQICV